MIEQNLTDLDKDYMVAWAKYCLSNDFSEISQQIQYLAENNQINAIQRWYAFKELGDNRIIDSNANALNGYTFDEYLVETRIEYSKQKDNFLDLRNECMAIDKSLNDEDDIRRIEYLRGNMAGFDFLKMYEKSINMAIGTYKVTKNPIYLERADELSYYCFYLLFQKPSLTLKLRHRKTVHLLRKALNKAQNSKNAIRREDCMIYEFGLAKALFLFDYPQDSKAVAEGRMLMAKIANKQYINTPTPYVASVVQQPTQSQTQTKPKQKIKKSQTPQQEEVVQQRPIKNEIDELFRSKPKRKDRETYGANGEIDEIFMQAQKNVEHTDEATK